MCACSFGVKITIMELCDKIFWTFLISWVLVTQSVSAQLPNPCKHNEFRCSEGAKCLQTEKLCNGVNDCPRGEDERGSPQWDCSKFTLSTDCDQSVEIKCRYGGCVPKTQQCDGISNCWGGNDESIELCSNRGPPKLQPVRPPQQIVEPKILPRPSTIITIKPKQQPTRTGESGSFSSCPPLEKDDGFRITCEINEKNYPCTNTRRRLPIGTKATYTCRNYYKPPAVGSQRSEIVCQRDGTWSAIRQSFSCTLDCGEGGYEQASFIVGGSTSTRGKWRWHVALYAQNPPKSEQWEYFCGGILISENAILTAAHCASMTLSSESRKSSEVRVVLGKFLKSFNTEERGIQRKLVKNIIVHEDYNSLNMDSDLAILILDEKAEMTKEVHPVCLPEKDCDEFTQEDMGMLAGWGRSLNDEFKEELQEAKLPVISNQVCRNSHPALHSIVRRTTFCAGYTNGTSACDGDSGSGLVFRDVNQRHKWKVQGIVSAGIPKQGGGCQSIYYTVFTKVVEYRDWIDKTLDRHSTRR